MTPEEIYKAALDSGHAAALAAVYNAGVAEGAAVTEQAPTVEQALALVEQVVHGQA